MKCAVHSAGGMSSMSASIEGRGMGALLRVSGTTFAFPGRCSMVKSNSASDKHQRANLEFCGAIDERNFRFA